MLIIQKKTCNPSRASTNWRHMVFATIFLLFIVPELFAQTRNCVMGFLLKALEWLKKTLNV